MSDHDELDELARALRAMTDEAPASKVASTRARVVASATRRSGRPSWALAAAAALAVVLGGSTVWAFFTGRIWSAETPEARPEAVEQGAADRRARGERREAPPATFEPDPARDQAVSAPANGRTASRPAASEPTIRAAREVTSEHRARGAAVNGRTASRPAASEPANRGAREIASEHQARGVEPAPAEPAEPPIDPAERRAYDAAHALHFVEGDWPGAVRAWDGYLAAFPHGRFGLEARYNRALALVHAGRFAEAREALTPFADGRFGAYRRSEARALLEALADEPAR